MKRLNKKGFTLIELLAVIIILGVLMIIAVPAVTKYINDSRKNAYVDSGAHFIDSVMKEVISGNELKMYDTSTIYMIAVGNDKAKSCISLESGGKSPFSDDWEYAYVGVTYSDNGYKYYYMSEDGSGNLIPFVDQNELIKEGFDRLTDSYADLGSGATAYGRTPEALSTALKTQYASGANATITGTNLTAYAAIKNEVEHEESGKTITSIVLINKPSATGNCRYQKASS